MLVAGGRGRGRRWAVVFDPALSPFVGRRCGSSLKYLDDHKTRDRISRYAKLLETAFYVQGPENAEDGPQSAVRT